MSEAAPKDAPCAHCGRPVPANLVGDGPAFCCTGCEGVYYALSEAGLEGFYRLRELDADDVPPRPAETPSSGVGKADRLVLDRPEFLERHTKVLDDGSRQAKFVLDGVHCAGCVWLVERMPRYVDGVINARLELGHGRLELRWDPERVALSEMVEWLSRFGYVAHPLNDHDQGARSQAERKLLGTMGASWALAANVMLLALPHYAGLELADDPVLAHGARWLSLILTTVALGVGGQIFFRRALMSLRSAVDSGKKAWLRLSMDVPISFGVLAAYAASAYATVTGGGQIWFDSVTMLIAGLVTARWLQLRASQKATEATSRLLSLIPRSARRITARDDQPSDIEQVGVEELQVGEHVEVRAGDVVPVDGRIVDGQSSLYRAVLTGESRPEPVGPGEAVHAGETNLEGVLRIEVEAVGEATRVGKLLSWVQSHNEERAPVVQLADRIGGVFVLATIFVALLTGLAWQIWGGGVQLEPMVAVLVVACPCALGMATPLALAVGVGKAARQGLFVKHEDVLENVDKLGWMVLDKTGTLTEGTLSVVEQIGSAAAVDLAACLEAKSSHPIASAIVAAGSDERGRLVEDVTEVAGCGVSGMVDGQQVQVGRPGWIETLVDRGEIGEESAHAELAQQVDAIADRGQTPVAIAVDGRLEAVVALGDRIRPEAPAFVARLRQMDIEPVILSGDHPKVCEKFAQEVGVGEKFARGGLSPEEKRDIVSSLIQDGQRQAGSGAVAMVGDGVNDAAALQAADIGICIAGSTDVALAAADVFSTRKGLVPVAKLLAGAEGVMATVRRNLTLSLGYNALAVTLAAVGLIGPLAAAILMPLSSLAVVTLSLSQSSFEPDGLDDTPVLDTGALADISSSRGSEAAAAQLTRKPIS